MNVSSDEISELLKKLKCDKDVGHNELHAEALMHSHERVLALLALYFC